MDRETEKKRTVKGSEWKKWYKQIQFRLVRMKTEQLAGFDYKFIVCRQKMNEDKERLEPMRTHTNAFCVDRARWAAAHCFERRWLSRP